MKSTLIYDMRAFCIFISEARFLANAHEELASLRDIPVTVIQQKLKVISFVQRVVIPSHPQSLFVPAFLQEAWLSNPLNHQM